LTGDPLAEVINAVVIVVLLAVVIWFPLTLLVHEFGHYWMAHLVGLKAKVRWTDKKLEDDCKTDPELNERYGDLSFWQNTVCVYYYKDANDQRTEKRWYNIDHPPRQAFILALGGPLFSLFGTIGCLIMGLLIPVRYWMLFCALGAAFNFLYGMALNLRLGSQISDGKTMSLAWEAASRGYGSIRGYEASKPQAEGQCTGTGS